MFQVLAENLNRNETLIGGIVSIVIALLIIAWPHLLSYLVALALLIWGVLALVAYFR